MLFDAVRHWSYRQPQPEDLQQWVREAQERAVTWGYRVPNKRGFSDAEMLAVGKSVGEWTWGKNFRRPEADIKEKRMLQLIGAENRRAKNHDRNEAILGLHAEGLSVRQIAAHVGLGRNGVHKVLKRGTAEIAATPEELARALQQ